MESKRLLKEVYTAIFQHWLMQKRKRDELWISDETHQCNLYEKCRVTNPHCRVYDFRDGENRLRQHVCFEGCDSRHSSFSLRMNISNVFICENTGKFHVCGPDCDETTIRSRNLEHVCRMSGLTRGSEYHDTYTASADKGECSVSNNRKRKFISAQNGERRARHEEWLQIMGLESKSLGIAVQMVDLLLFNKKRQQLENDRLRKMGQQSKSIVNTYRRRCEKANKPVCVMYAQWLYADSMQRNRPPPYLHISKTVMERVVQYYAYFCMAVYAKLLKYVFVQDNSKDTPSLKDCIPPILYIMKEGLKTSSDAALFSEDMFLGCFLPEENTLNHFGVKKTQFTNVRNLIANGTVYAIEESMLSPTKLEVIPVSLKDIIFSLEHSIHDMFTELNPIP